MRLMVTGADGFVGSILCPWLEKLGHDVIRVRRTVDVQPQTKGSFVLMPNICSDSDWSGLLEGIDAIVHLAAKVHVMAPDSNDSFDEYMEVNVAGTARLAAEAARQGVTRFIYLSSIKVNGPLTTTRPFSADQEPNPLDNYSISKWKAECELRRIEAEQGIDVVIIRPPLVYGPNVKGNLEIIMRLLRLGLPLPFGAIDNRRDLVSVYNLCDLICLCIEHHRAAGGTFLVSDGRPMSTPNLIRHLARGQRVRPRLLAVPIASLATMLKWCGRREVAARLFGNLEVDIKNTTERLGWVPPYSIEQSIRRMFDEQG